MQDDRPLELETLEDGCIKVCLTNDGITKCCTVSSQHLIEPKYKHLKRAIAAEAIQAYAK